MSSHTAAAFEAPRSNIRSQRAWSNKEVLAHGFAITTSFLWAAYPAHVAGWNLFSFGAASMALFCVTLLPQPFAGSSPLEIHRTARLLYGILLGLAIVLADAMLFPKSAISLLKLFLSFVMMLAVIRTFVKVESSPSLMAECIEPKTSAGYAIAKRWLDALIAGTSLVLLSPFLLVIAVVVKLDSDGPVLFSQQRVGYRGRPFWILKFRSMHVHAPKYHRSPANSEDFRITRVGRLLRRTSLDEIPQLINVLRGEMSLVGPRPEMPYIANTYTALQRERLDALPGITGLWQISPARALPIHHNMQYDLYYVAHQSLLLDLAILCRTTESVVRGIGAA
jgi:lipopolysaccharide/colanic/teichoic acid biosynthesis glycosyltransferase